MIGPFQAIFASGSFKLSTLTGREWMSGSGLSTHAGVNINEHTAMELSPVYRSLAILAEGEAQLPLSVGRKDGEARYPEPGHPLDGVLNTRANPYMSAFVFRSSIHRHVVSWGNGYAEIQRDGAGRVVALWPLMPDRTWPDTEDGKVVYRTVIDGKQYTLPPDRVLHVPALSYDGLLGQGPISLARESAGLSKALEAHGSRYFRNESTSGGFVEHPGQLSETAHARIKASIEEQGGLENAHRIKLLEEGMQFKPTTLPNDDAQFLETRQFQVAEWARWFGIPLHMLASETGATSWGTGITQISLGFVRYTLQPWSIRWEQEMRYKLLTKDERERGYYIKHNFESLLRGDPAARAAYYTAALDPTTGWMTRDEVRPLEDLNPLEPGKWPALGGVEIPE